MFKKFSTDGRMNAKNCADFINSCTNDYCKEDDYRVKEHFKDWDDDNDGFITGENFLSFYTEACTLKPSVVWKNL